MKSCVIQREVVYVSTTAGVLLLLYAFTSSAYGQSSAPFANCIMMYDKTLQVLLTIDDDCNEQQFSKAVAYYKANGFPHEGSYSDMFGIKTMQLLTDYGNSLDNEMTK
jgi:hypothetical protein